MLRDRISVDHFSDGPISGYEYGTPERRELVVDLFYRCMKSRLVFFVHPEYLQEAGFSSLEGYCSELVKGELESTGSGIITNQMLLWLQPEIETTSAGDALYLEVFGTSVSGPLISGLRPAPVEEFSKRICQIFRESHLPWTGKFMFPANQ